MSNVAKEAIIETICVFLGLPSDSLKSLEKATKNDLIVLESAIIKTAHIVDNKRKS